jgi:hypothetical protein
VVAGQAVFDFTDVEATMVGFRFPARAEGMNVPGYHLHFVSADRKRGGHVLDCEVSAARVEVDDSVDVRLEVPAGVELPASLRRGSGRGPSPGRARRLSSTSLAEMGTGAPQTIALDLDDGVATLTLNRPEKRNALSIALREELVAALSEWRDDPGVRVVIVTGEGPSFCAGFDLDEFANQELAREIRNSSARYHHAVWSFRKPTIAAVNGPAFGGGLRPHPALRPSHRRLGGGLRAPGGQVRGASPVHSAALDRWGRAGARSLPHRPQDRCRRGALDRAGQPGGGE